MCLILFSWQPEADSPLIIAANRDEFYSRPTQTIHFWEDKPDILGGRDLLAGGSWLAINKSGRLAAITNYRKLPMSTGTISRGRLVCDFLESSLSPKNFMANVKKKADQYSGFNLLAGDINDLYYFSNIEGNIKRLKPGIYGLCNHLLDTPWPKLVKTKKAFAKQLDDNNYSNPESLHHIMQNTEQAPDHLLPDTGIGLEKERLISSPFIASKDYGTRNTSILIFDQNKKVDWHEQTYSAGGSVDLNRRIAFKLKLFIT